MKLIKHRTSTWEKIYDIKIYDPDGWRTDSQSMYKPIDEQEWLTRMTISTCMFGKNGIKNLKERENAKNNKN